MAFEPLDTAHAASWIVYEDSHLLVVNKPAGMSVQAAERQGPPDVLHRLQLQLAQREHCEPASVYLRAHLHLERDTSGLVLVVKSPQANPGVADQAQRRAIRTSFVVACEGTLRAQDGSLCAHVSRGPQAAIQVSRSPKKDTERLLMTYRLIDRHQRRLLLEVQPSWGSARHVRAVLEALLGLRVAGASMQCAAPKLLMHAHRLQMHHPINGTPMQWSSPAPWLFTAWVRTNLHASEEMDAALVRQALLETASERAWTLSQPTPQAYRLLHGEGEGLVGLDVDRFGDWAVVWAAEEVPEPLREAALDAAMHLGAAGVYLKIRPKGRTQAADRDTTLAPETAVRGTSAPEPMIVEESGLRYQVKLGDGLATGLFLDQRDNREWVRVQAEGRAVLNLFAYTCSFTVAAAAGGARRSVSVDIASGALEVGQRNLQLNGLHGDHQFVCDDVARWLRSRRASREKFDLVILDPPSYGIARGSRFVLAQDFAKVAADCFSLMAPGALMLACINHRSTSAARLRHWLHEAAAAAGRTIEWQQAPALPADFATGPTQQPHMKAVRLRISS